MSNTIIAVVEEVKAVKTPPRKSDGKTFTVYEMELSTGDTIKCGFKRPSVTEGERYEIDYKEGRFGYELLAVNPVISDINTSTPTSKTSNKQAPTGNSWEFPISPTNYNRSVCRREAVGHAIEIHAKLLHGGVHVPCTIEEVIATAKRLEAYTTGDEDMEAVKNAAKEYKNIIQGVLINDSKEDSSDT